MFERIHHAAGILLYEALIAVVVLSFGISFAMRAFVYASKSKKITQVYIQSIEILQQKMIEYETNKNIEAGDYHGTINYEGADYEWTIHIETLDQEQIDEADLNNEQVERYWKILGSIGWVQDKKRKITLETIVYIESSNEEEIETEDTITRTREEAF